MTTSYHVHTRWSDGHADLPGYIDAAKASALAELGVSDHLALTPDGRTPGWSMTAGDLTGYVAELRGTTTLDGLVLRAGIEADYFPETVSLLGRTLAPFDFDYVLGSVHVVDGFAIDSNSKDWAGLSRQRQDELWSRYWLRVAEMAATGLFDIAAHLDLPKKFGFHPSRAVTTEAEAALDAIAAAGMAVEVNTSGWHAPAAEAYPSPALLRAAHERRIPIVINADAHRPEHVARDFDRAAALVRELGCGRTVRFERRRMIL